MTTQTLTAAKTWYENELRTKLAEALGVEERKITTTWNVDGYKVVIDLTSGDVITRYTLIYANNNLTFDGISYKQIFTDPVEENVRMLTGIQAKNVSIDLATLGALSQMISSVLAQEYKEPAVVTEATEATETTPEEIWDGNENGEHNV